MSESSPHQHSSDKFKCSHCGQIRMQNLMDSMDKLDPINEFLLKDDSKIPVFFYVARSELVESGIYFFVAIFIVLGMSFNEFFYAVSLVFFILTFLFGFMKEKKESVLGVTGKYPQHYHKYNRIIVLCQASGLTFVVIFMARHDILIVESDWYFYLLSILYVFLFVVSFRAIFASERRLSALAKRIKEENSKIVK